MIVLLACSGVCSDNLPVASNAVILVATLTIIVLVNSTELPAASETLYINVYVPGVEASTEPEVVIELEMSPSTSSEAEAPASVYESPSSILIVEEPTRVIVGAPVSGTITSGIGSSSLHEMINEVNKTANKYFFFHNIDYLNYYGL
mgnify:CR=1 FL=1